jgi:hypothetical protein
MPDWERMAADVDGVHLSWAGAITAEGCVVSVPGFGDDVVTMLRYWSSERTLWLNDVFLTPERLPPVVISDDYAAATHGPPMTSAEREVADREIIVALLGRDPWV